MLVPSQKMNNVSTSPAMTSPSIEVMNSSM